MKTAILAVVKPFKLAVNRGASDPCQTLSAPSVSLLEKRRPGAPTETKSTQRTHCSPSRSLWRFWSWLCASISGPDRPYHLEFAGLVDFRDDLSETLNHKWRSEQRFTLDDPKVHGERAGFSHLLLGQAFAGGRDHHDFRRVPRFAENFKAGSQVFEKAFRRIRPVGLEDDPVDPVQPLGTACK